ncbi:hypothetical protein LXL04_015579 [Taraxacum kok-saghyz]
MLHIAQLSTDTNTKLDQLIELMMTQLINQPPPPPSPTCRNNQNIRLPKILFPNFDGINTLHWLFQANNYFEYYFVPIIQRVALVVYYFIVDALSWYKHLANNHLLGNWQEVSRSLKLRFGPSTYKNRQSTLFKLQQTSTVFAYHTTFEKINTCVTCVGNDTLLKCFLSGLKPDIQNKIRMKSSCTTPRLSIKHMVSLN